MMSPELVTAEAALRAGRWDEAAAGFADVIAHTDDPRAHDGLAQVAWWLDDAGTALAAREAAYRGFRGTGDHRAAALVAATLGYDSILFGLGIPVGRGWLARAADLLTGQDGVPESGWLEIRRAEVALAAEHAPRAGLEHARAAESVGRATGDGDLVVVGQALAGLAMVRLGDVALGMALLDGSAGAATAGDVEDLMWMGKVCCWVINACQDAHDFSRAALWCARVDEICSRHDLAPLFSVCRIQYASVQMAQGECVAAEATLTGALHRLQHSKRGARLEAVAHLGELRRRQGRHDEAEALLVQAGYQTSAVISRCHLHLTEGDAERAWSSVTELLRSLPADQQLERAEVLAMVVEAGAAAGRSDDARAAAAQLRAMADLIGTDALLAESAAAQARLALNEAIAISSWQDAVRHAAAAGLGFDEAEFRLKYAACLQALGDSKGVLDQAGRALDLLKPLGVGPSIDRARALLGHDDASGPLSARQVDVLRLLARGLTNTDIAAQLLISEHTVHRHVANIYRILDVSSRAAAATYAASRGLT
ncbi:LuxR family transcriptional regulator [Aeromicrobium sp.]|uniref:LuxR family transcriptional regulator n=1 Tax=Aeromicrobium sp. TaxID=1871063 RepID=UPI00199AAB84|nr:LuxR family transcriptional regulator [Aeromicrobium sp.]MBC7630586.1 helix-turn-helix transcriptional regulator [Aeromicrobium sp.]